MQRSIPFAQLIMSLAVVGILGVAPVQAQTIDGQLPNDGGNHVGKTIEITDDSPGAADHCGFFWEEYACVVIDPAAGTSFATTCSLPETLAVAVGDQFDVQSQTTCDGQLDLQLVALPSAAVDGQLPNDGGNHVGKTIEITDAAPSVASHCALSWFEYACVVNDPAAGTSFASTVSLPDTLTVAVGSQFVILAQSPCDGQYNLVLVPGDPAALLQSLVNDVLALNLNQGIENGLDAKLEAAVQALEDINQNNDVAACNALQAFINAVQAQSGNKIAPSDADALIDQAESIMVLLDCAP